jgi:hypothetical protein
MKENREKVLDSKKTWNHKNKPKVNKRSRDWAKDNRDRDKQNRASWFEKNPDKYTEYSRNRKVRNHEITNQEWESCLCYFNHSCAYCGFDEKEHKDKYNQQLHKEHVIYDGSNKLDNCVPACKDCNSHKWEYSLNEWYTYSNSIFSQERLDIIYKWIKDDYKLYIDKNKGE